MALKKGETLKQGQYRILRLIGRGGYGFVYHARDQRYHRDVAIKELLPALVDDPAIMQRFLREARATASLDHPSIARVWELFKEHGNQYMVLEYLPGGSLAARLETERTLSLSEALYVGLDLCGALQVAHEHNIIHCDIKPDNVLFDARGRAKLVDFGIAHISLSTNTWKTARDTAMGTLLYMAPEQLDGVRNDPRVDIYALGALLYRALAGYTYAPFSHRPTASALADNIALIRFHVPKPIPHLPSTVNAVLLRALSKEPDQRFSSAAEMGEALMEAALPHLSPVAALPLITPYAARRSNRYPRLANPSLPTWPKWLPVAIGAVNLLLFIAVATLLFTS